MSGFIAKQPNGLYCRWSSIVDCVTHYNMTLEDYAHYIMERDGFNEIKAMEEATDIINNHLHPFEEIENENTERYGPDDDGKMHGNMSMKKHKRIIKEMKKPLEKCSMILT